MTRALHRPLTFGEVTAGVDKDIPTTTDESGWFQHRRAARRDVAASMPPFGTMSRIHLARAALASVLLSLPSMTAAQQIPAHVEEGLFEVHVPLLGAITLPALVDTAQTVLLPLEPVLSHVGYDVGVEPRQRVWRVGPMAPANRLVLDPPRYYDVHGDAVAIPPAAIVLYGENVYVSTRVLGTLLAAEVDVDWSALRVVLLRPDPPFPAQVRARAEERRSRLFRPTDPADRPLVRYPPRSGGVILDWSVSSSPLDERTLARGALGAAVLGGDLTVAGSLAAGRETDRTAQASYRRIFPESSWINQLLVGQVLTQDMAPRSIIGAVVSNIPQQRDVLFGEIPIMPDIPEGWEFEVYQAGQLVGFSSARADEAVMVPVRYGHTPIEVRMVGPSGEEVVSRHRHLVPVTHLPPGRTEYSAGAGVCPRGACDAIGYGEVRHGVGRSLTVGGGAHGVSEDGTFRIRPSALMRYVPARHWSLGMEARASEFLRASVDRINEAGQHIGVDASVHQSPFGQPSFLGGTGSRWQLQARTALRPLHLTGRVDGLTGEGIDRVRLGVGHSIPRGYGEIAFEAGRFGANRVTGRATSVFPEQWWIFDRPVSVSGSFSATRDGLRLIELSSSLRPRPESYLSTAIQWDGSREALHLSITFRQILKGARINASAVRRPRNSTFTLSANGSIAMDGVQGVHFTDRTVQGRAGVVGRVYYDRAGNQVFEDGDEPAAGVSVLIGGVRVRTDSEGFYRAWNVTPYEVTTVAVDTLSGIDPRYTVLAGGIVLRPVPHMPNRVDFPLAETREMLGRVVRESGVGIGGVEVELLHMDTGRRQAERTFSDGSFYVRRLLPGEWLVRIAQASLDALQNTSDPPEVRVHVDTSDPDPLLELEPFVLQDADPPIGR